MERTYKVNIKECNKNLTAKQKIMIKDTSDAKRLDDVTKENALIIEPDIYAILEVHNEKSENKDYDLFIIIDKDGQKYTTSSISFWNAFCDIMDDMEGEDEDFSIKIYRLPSKNYQGRDFITCSII